MAVNEESINSFMEFCATDNHKAQQFLQHCDGNLEQAVQLYFQTGGNLENSHEGENNLMNELRLQQELEMEVRRRRPAENANHAAAAPNNRPIVPRRARTASPAEDGWLQWIYTIVTLPVQFTYSTLYELIAFFVNILFGRRLPPVTDPRGDVNNFVTSYVQSYVAGEGADRVQNAVNFYLKSYSEALQEANRSLRPMFVYLQNTANEETHRFVTEVLHSPQFSALVVAENFLVFGISVNLPEGAKVASILRPSRYPFLSLLLPQNSRMVESIRFEGYQLSVQNIVSNIDFALNDYRQEMELVRVQRAEREANRRLREEQEREYEESAAKDRARIKERRRLESERQEAVERELQMERQTATRRERVLDYRKQMLAASLPVYDGSDAIRMQVRFPDGSKFESKFAPDDSLERLFDMTVMQEKCPPFFTIHTTYPRKELHCAPQWYSELRNEQLTVDGSEPVPFVQPQTFKDVGLEKSVAVAVQDCLA
ncbi:hypothetical protein WR25_10861 [Diploscapter pachys]|uniref:UBX domain-containing protein n=1 Tax=Diploscapter pachys TaxID=2018661 RepID=A0A2A2LQN9_9BILA|nr:hypothetical protein WR25_10861 [Diploscapter pachys]